jgi:hypothetical protein
VYAADGKDADGSRLAAPNNRLVLSVPQVICLLLPATGGINHKVQAQAGFVSVAFLDG